MTGRRGRMISLLDGSVQYQLRSEADVSLELLNIAEKQRFMDDEKVTCKNHLTIVPSILNTLIRPLTSITFKWITFD